MPKILSHMFIGAAASALVMASAVCVVAITGDGISLKIFKGVSIEASISGAVCGFFTGLYGYFNDTKEVVQQVQPELEVEDSIGLSN
ncbi:hypothetical protein Cyrtocomes_00588 [Candidatus Cyrtobacter comes]|uniref:Uncharacterized protein n=1 Tax=Candidatus Cyrtobacter comes TaxID=675776 RepID=A0ABU5L8H0_9RICK|nr:hypothetical protein [Candidatus Cyrtobacter comes]MDZ5762215.1 hypothetical protein [Candidatus Cyrtobacter comes]